MHNDKTIKRLSIKRLTKHSHTSTKNIFIVHTIYNMTVLKVFMNVFPKKQCF